MPKIFKKSITFIIIALGFLLLTGMEVDAVTIETTQELKDVFEGISATVNNNTVNLNENIIKQDTYEFLDGEYVINLNGYTFSEATTINVTGGTLTINDTTGTGGNITSLDTGEDGKLVINNGTFKTILNRGKLTIENGNFNCVDNQGSAIINGGTFTSEENALIIGLEATTNISAGTFNGDNYTIIASEYNSVNSGFLQKITDKDSYYIYDERPYYSSESNGDGRSYFTFACKNEVKFIKLTEYEKNLIKKIAPDGKNAVLKTVKPSNSIEAEFFLTDVVNYMLAEDKYRANAYATGEDFSKLIVNIIGENFSREYELNVTYEEPKTNKNVEQFISKMKAFSEENVDTYYQITDLGLINYYITSEESELWKIGAPSRALRYSDDIIKLSDGGAIKFFLDLRAGMQAETLMFESAFGEMGVFYDDSLYANKQQGLYLKRVIYIPNDTADKKESYIAAAQNRINQYLGKDNLVTVEYGGKLEDLEEWMLDSSILNEDTDGNYYNITVKGKTYKFYIMKGTNEQLKMPVYTAKDYNTNIEISSSDANVPLDTAITVDIVKNSNIEQTLGTNVYVAYDISLYSDAKQVNITKLENGKFKVSIPIPENLKNKEITVIYINSKGEKEEHIANVKDGIATFETDHFSTYILTEKDNKTTYDEKDNTPETGTIGILNYVILLTSISFLGIIVLKRKYFN